MFWSGQGVDDPAVFHIVFSNDSHFCLFTLLIRNPHFLSFKPTVLKHSLVEMEPILIDDEFSGVNVDTPFRNTKRGVEKSNKCNQCEYCILCEKQLDKSS